VISWYVGFIAKKQKYLFFTQEMINFPVSIIAHSSENLTME